MKSIWLEIHKIVGQENPDLARRMFDKVQDKFIIGNVEFIYSGPESGHQYITPDGILELRFWMKGVNIDKIFIPYTDVITVFPETTCEITIYTPNPRIQTLDWTNERIERLMVHFKEQHHIKDVHKEVLPYKGMDISHPMRLIIDKKVGQASVTASNFQINVALREARRGNYIEVEVKDKKYGYVAPQGFPGGTAHLFKAFKIRMSKAGHGQAFQWLKDTAIPLGAMKAVAFSLFKSKYPLSFFKKLDIEHLDPDYGEAIIKYFQGTPQKFQASPEYHEIYPYLRRIHQRVTRSIREVGENVRKQMGIEFGDKVHYDYVDPFLGVNPLEGIVEKRNGLPMVKITKGRTVDGRKYVLWHKGWRKI